MDKRWTESYGQEDKIDDYDEQNVLLTEWHWSDTVRSKSGRWTMTPVHCKLCGNWRTNSSPIFRSVGGKIIEIF